MELQYFDRLAVIRFKLCMYVCMYEFYIYVLCIYVTYYVLCIHLQYVCMYVRVYIDTFAIIAGMSGAEQFHSSHRGDGIAILEQLLRTQIFQIELQEDGGIGYPYPRSVCATHLSHIYWHVIKAPAREQPNQLLKGAERRNYRTGRH